MTSARSAQSLTFSCSNSLVAGPAIRTLSARSDLDVIVGASLTRDCPAKLDRPAWRTKPFAQRRS